MVSEGIWKRVRAAAGNAVAWGAVWSALWVLVVVGRAMLGVLGVLPPLSGLEVLGGILRFGVMFGIAGFVAGGAFSGVMSLLYRGRRLADIDGLRFSLGGAVVAGLAVPLFMQTMNVLSGDGPVPWGLVLDDAVLTTVFGGVAAAASLAVAKRTEAVLLAEAGSEAALLAEAEGDRPGEPGSMEKGRASQPAVR